MVLRDGTELEADLVVLATGYKNMRDGIREVLGDRVADRCKPIWGLDEERGEIGLSGATPGIQACGLTVGIWRCRVRTRSTLLCDWQHRNSDW